MTKTAHQLTKWSYFKHSTDILIKKYLPNILSANCNKNTLIFSMTQATKLMQTGQMRPAGRLLSTPDLDSLIRCLLWCVYQGLSLVLTEGALKDGEERDHLMEEDSRDAELLPGYQWLLQDLPKLPLFDSVRGLTSSALQQVSPPTQIQDYQYLLLAQLIVFVWFSISGHSHGDWSSDHQCILDLPFPACTSGGAVTPQWPGLG